MSTGNAEGLKLAARPTPYDNQAGVPFRALTLVSERYLQLLDDAESRPVANFPARTDEASVLIRTPSRTMYALRATRTTGRKLRLVQRASNRNGFEAWRQLVAENAPKRQRA